MAKKKNKNTTKIIPEPVETDTCTVCHPVFRAGDVIYIIGLVSKPEFNDRLGVIKKILANGRFKISINETDDLSIKQSNLEKLEQRCSRPNGDQCPNMLLTSRTGILVWPYVKNVCGIPSVNWLEHCKLDAMFRSPFDTDLSSKNWVFIDTQGLPGAQMSNGKFSVDPVQTGYMILKPEADPNMKNYEDQLKFMLKWRTPSKWLCIQKCEGKVVRQFCIYFDSDSMGPENIWISHMFAMSSKGHLIRSLAPRIKGSFLFVDRMQMIDSVAHRKTCLNELKQTLYNSNNYGIETLQPTSDGKFLQAIEENVNRISKFAVKLPTCDGICKLCDNFIMRCIGRKALIGADCTPQEESTVLMKAKTDYYRIAVNPITNLVDRPEDMEQKIEVLGKKLKQASRTEQKRVVKVVIAWCKSDLVGNMKTHRIK